MLVFAAAACSGAAGEAGSDSELTIGVYSGPVSLDPSQDSFTFGVVRPLTNAFLTHEAPDGSIQPWLATSWRYLDDNNTEFEFTLRDDARFSDGQPVNAEAVVTWLEYFADGSSVFVSNMGPINTIEAVDEWTVRIRLDEPNPIIPYLLSENGNWGAVSSPAAVADPSRLSTETIGAGPYVVDPQNSVTDQEYTLIPNEHYFDQAAIRYDRVTIKVIPDPNARLQAVRTGQVDVASGDLDTADAARDAGLDVLGQPARTAGLILADRSAGPLADLRVRQALNYAVDRDTITQALVGDHGVPTSQMISRDGVHPDYQDFYLYDPQKARSLLADAGYGDGFTLNVLEMGTAGKVGTPLAQAIASYWNEIGVTAEIVTAASTAEYVEQRRAQDHQVQYYSVINSPMYAAYQLALGPEVSLNPFGTDDPAMSDLFHRASRAQDPAQLWQDMSARTVTEAYFVPVFNTPTYYYVSDSVGGVELTPARPGYTWATEWHPR